MSFFSPEKANALIPTLTPLIDDLWRMRRELAIKLLEADPALRKTGRAESAGSERRGERGRCSELKAEIVRTISRIEAYGCVLKDVDLGLIDFPALRNGRPVFLCWKAGEGAVQHWHGTDENFTLRKAL
jgi:hypothetical protein